MVQGVALSFIAEAFVTNATHLATFLPDLCMLPTEDFRVKESVPLAWRRFRASLSADLRVLVGECDVFGCPSVVQGIKIEGGEESIMS